MKRIQKNLEEENSAAEDFYEEDSEKDTEEFLRRKPFQRLPVQKIMWKKMPGFLKKKLLLRRIRQLQKKMNGCIASRADLRKTCP